MSRASFMDSGGSKKLNCIFLLLYIAGMSVMLSIALATLNAVGEDISRALTDNIYIATIGFVVPMGFFFVFLFQAMLLLFEVKEITTELNRTVAKRLILGDVTIQGGSNATSIISKTFDFSDKKAKRKISALVVLRPNILVITERMQGFEELIIRFGGRIT